jgi:hypothetical protein
MLSARLRKVILMRIQDALNSSALDLNVFELAMFANLKKYTFNYRFLSNCLRLEQAKLVDWSPASASKLALDPLRHTIKTLIDSHSIAPFMLLRLEGGAYHQCPFSDYK